jgi:diguanylate cyclase (GGDEF)-like protein/PAS domain S-box-containing protein
MADSAEGERIDRPNEPLAADAARWLNLRPPLLMAVKTTLVLLLPIGLLAGYVYFLAVQERFAALAESNVQQVNRIAEQIDFELQRLILDVRALIAHPALSAYSEQPGTDQRYQLQQAMRFFATTKRDYQQVRLLDAQGMEVVRVEFNDGRVSVVPESALQPKGSRYYVRESMGLGRDEVYLSPLDLNVEHGKVEEPARPMLRLAQPVFDAAGKRVALLVLNYAAQHLIDRIRMHSNNSAQHQLLVGGDGYFILAPEADRDWAFMYDVLRDTDRFAVRFPEAAHALGLADRAMVETADGLFAMRKIRYPSRPQRASQPVRHWLSVSWVPREVMAAEQWVIIQRTLFVGGLVSVLAFVAALLIAILLDAMRGHREAENRGRTRLHAILHSASDGIVTIDAAGFIQSFNPAAEQVFGWTQAEVLDKPVSILMPASDALNHEEYLNQYLATGERQVIGQVRELRGRRRDGSEFPMEMSVSEAVIGGGRVFTGFVRDITQRKQMESHVRHQTLFDELTGLPNRRMLLSELLIAINSARARNMFGALLVLDLDHFKTISDALGHAAGDQVLRDLAARLRRSMRKQDLVVRLGGDEFAVVLDKLHSDEAQAARLAMQLAQSVGEVFREPLSIRDVTQSLTASIGVALYPVGEESADTLLKHADTAMNRAKGSGRNAIRFFRPSMEAEVNLRLQFMGELRNALLGDEFVVHYQPKIDVVARRIVGIEALIRWQHPARGLLMPGSFIDYAEDVGLISEIGEWVIARALRDIKRLENDLPQVAIDRVAVNISPRQFYASGFIRRLRELLLEADASAERLELEITENLMLDNVDLATKKMQGLREMGVSLALDDFGTGYSSLSYVRRLPFDVIKIDRSFIRAVDSEPAKAAMVETILSLDRVKPMSFIAEGVETASESDWLREHGCVIVQGFFYSKPLPYEALCAFASSFLANGSMDHDAKEAHG